MAKFCRSCGLTLVPSNPPEYDGETGLKVNSTCPSGKCEHTGLWHDYGPYKGLFNPFRTCQRCGDKSGWD